MEMKEVVFKCKRPPFMSRLWSNTTFKMSPGISFNKKGRPAHPVVMFEGSETVDGVNSKLMVSLSVFDAVKLANELRAMADTSMQNFKEV